MSCLELVPAGKKLWCQVITQLGNAHTTTGTEGLLNKGDYYYYYFDIQ